MICRRRAFTLIELLVVIAIIALLMSILMPALNRVKKQAKTVACQSRLRSWGMLFKLYTDDSDGYFNEGWGYEHHHPGRPGEYGLWMNALRPYYRDNWGMLLCPMATRMVETQYGQQDWGTFKAWFKDAANRYRTASEGTTKRFVGSYSINNWTNYMIERRPPNREVAYFWKNVNNVTAKNPVTGLGKPVSTNNIPVFADATWHDAWPFEDDAPPAHPDEFGWESPTVGSQEMKHFCINRHNGFVNFLFMDWSTRRIGLKEIWTLRWHREYNINGQWTRAGGVSPSDWPVWMRKFKDY